jgi:hypothetical protein
MYAGLTTVTTSVGAALWAADIEKGNSRPQDSVHEPIVNVAMPEGRKEL